MCNGVYVFEFESEQITASGQEVFLPPDLLYTRVLQLILDTDCARLPKQIILKKEDCQHKHLFDNELRIYQKLEALQGTAIPQMHGLATIHGTRALVLSDIGGTALVEEGTRWVESTRLEEMLDRTIRQIWSMGVRLKDLSLLNVHLCEDAIWIVDFEEAEIMAGRVDESDVEDQAQASWHSSDVEEAWLL
ncbi:hypothetical protein ColLi_08588 [Colletotrichum liriopes]|uniref:Protein kinase domain-containing protein n=1 Tax=Colletotrichum liriopes TaxID=708192 RepID=A0AA37LUE4_9PEZI|nr:hypothetical protein ColLi_08588 [Colletotrichum liriopes]